MTASIQTLETTGSALMMDMEREVSAMGMGERATEVEMEAKQVAVKHDADGTNFAETYREWRRAYYDRFPAFWGSCGGAQIEEYAVYGALEVPQEQVQALRTASARLYQIMTRLALVLQQTDDHTLLEMGIPEPALPYVHIVMPEMPAIMCGRFEFAMTAEGPKLLECNAETPTFVVELFHMNGQVCKDFGLIDPNAGCQEQLAQALHASIQAGISWVEPKPEDVPSIVFSAYANRMEERNTAEFYQRLLATRGHLPYRTAFRGLDELRVSRDGLFLTTGERIDVLYKLYPTEHLIEDEAPDRTPVGLVLMDLVRKRRLAVINPPISFVLQNKALVALLWAMHLAHSDLFTPEEHKWIEQYVLPTFFSPSDVQDQPVFAGPYVVKPVYGREGISIALRDGQTCLEQSAQNIYDNQVKVCQHYVALPTTTLQTEQGATEVSLVHNCFIVGGTPSAIGVRASRKLIFDDFAYFLPICSPGASTYPHMT